MNSSPNLYVTSEIERNCYDLFYNNSDIHIFEKWVYENNDLKSLLSKDDYLALLSLNYKTEYSHNEVYKIMMKYLDLSKFETKRVLDLLYKSLETKELLPIMLPCLYHLYCNGYIFLQKIAIEYGLNCIVPPSNYKVNHWTKLTEFEKEEIINSFYPEIENDIKDVIELIENGKIILTGLKDDNDRYLFIDNKE